MFIGPCIIAIVNEWNTNLMSLAILFHLLCAQHVSDINISIFRSLRLCCWITTSVVLFCKDGCFSISVTTHRKVTLMLKHPSLQNKTTDVVIHQHSRKLLKMDILMSETCWAHNKWNKMLNHPSSIICLYLLNARWGVLRVWQLDFSTWQGVLLWQNYRHYFNVNTCVPFSMLKYLLALFALKSPNRIFISKVSVES